MFLNYSSAFYWRVDFQIRNEQVNSLGKASLFMKKNSLPSNGECHVNQTSGINLLTYFDIICSNWTDLDGAVEKYEYMGKFLKSQSLIHFGLKN